MKKNIMTMQNIFQAQVCSEGTWDEAEAWLREASPAGTSNNWCKAQEVQYKPVQCSDFADRTHYMFEC